MSNSNFQLKKLSVSFTGIGVSSALGTRTIRNWGSDKATTIEIVSMQPEANIVKTGSDGSTLTLRQYDNNTMKLTIKLGIDTDDDKYFKNIVALHKAGSETIFAISYHDETNGEVYATIGGSVGTLPAQIRGSDVDNNVAYVFNMPECLYTPPTL